MNGLWIIILLSVLLTASLCKAAAKGNIYCPACGSENRFIKIAGPYSNQSDFIYQCADCQYTWPSRTPA